VVVVVFRLIWRSIAIICAKLRGLVLAKSPALDQFAPPDLAISYEPNIPNNPTIRPEETVNPQHDQENVVPSAVVFTHPPHPAITTMSISSPAKTYGRHTALVLNENNQGIAVGSGALKPRGRFTIEAWVCPSSAEGKLTIFAEGDTLFYLEGGELKFQTDPAGLVASSIGAVLMTGKWYHVVVAYQGSHTGQTKLYINGVQNDNQTAVSSVLALNSSYLAGHPNFPANSFRGKMLEIRIWRHSRSLADIQENMTYFLTGRELGLARCWAIDEGFGNTIVGKTTTRAVGTIDGEAVWEEVEIPLKVDLNAKERLTRSTGLADYAFWYAEMAKQQQTGTPPAFRRGRIWA
jgi:cyanobactin cluster PatC/TenC/TruC protein